MKILFVCRYNRFRSRIAEAYFKKINKNKGIKVDSAGIFKGRPIDSLEKTITKTQGVSIGGSPKSMSSVLLSKQDIIIIVADDVPKELFKYEGRYLQKVIVWGIKDNSTGNRKKIEIIVKKIKKKVDLLVKQLEKKK